MRRNSPSSWITTLEDCTVSEHRCCNGFGAAVLAVTQKIGRREPTQADCNVALRVTVKARNENRFGNHIRSYIVTPAYHAYWSADLQSTEKGEV